MVIAISWQLLQRESSVGREWGALGQVGVLQVSLTATERLKEVRALFVVLLWLSVHGE